MLNSFTLKTLQNTVILLLLILTSFQSFGQEIPKLTITDFSDLPAAKVGGESFGYAGMLGGHQKDVFIVAGGANFPEGLPWEGGKKIWSKEVYIFEDGKWRLSAKELPIPLGYAASISTEKGILTIGGNNADSISDKVLLIAYNTSTKEVEISEYPKLPEPLAFASAVLVDDFVYVVGGKNKEGSTNSFYKFNLKTKDTWEKLTDFPGKPRALHTVAVQETKTNKKLFVIGGRNEVAGKKSETLTTYLSYDLKENVWTNEGDLKIEGASRVLMGASAETMGSMHIMVYGGSDEILFNELENIGLKLKTTENDSLVNALKTRRNTILNNHKGFSKDVLAYNTITKQWFLYDVLKEKIPVTALSFKKGDDFVMVSGEVSPGIRTAKVTSFKVADAAHPFGVLNYTVLALYLLISGLIGLDFARKQKATED